MSDKDDSQSGSKGPRVQPMPEGKYNKGGIMPRPSGITRRPPPPRPMRPQHKRGPEPQ